MEEKGTKKTDETTEQRPKYVNGEKYPYNRFEDTFGDAGRYSDETPRNEPFHIFKILPKGEKLKKVYLAIILFFAVLSVIGGIIGFLYLT